jgi:hypothetical protein
VLPQRKELTLGYVGLTVNCAFRLVREFRTKPKPIKKKLLIKDVEDVDVIVSLAGNAIYKGRMLASRTEYASSDYAVPTNIF